MKGKVFTLYINLQDKELDLSVLKGKKLIIALCPSSINNLEKKDIELIKELLKKGCLLGQRGNLGICKYPHTITEPWHENLCLHNPSLDFEEQLSFMKKGKKKIKETFGIEPEVYCPINHLYDINTVKAAQILKYKYMMDLNLASILPYENNGLTILPEAKLGEKGAEKMDLVYTSYGDLQKKEVKDFIKINEFVLPGEIKSSINQSHFLVINEIQKKIRKLEKDLKKLKEKYKAK